MPTDNIQGLTLEHIEDEHLIVMVASGQINVSTSKVLQEPLLAAAETSVKPVVLDLQAVDFISSAGLRVLMMAATRLRKRDERLKVRGVQPMVLAVLKLANFTRIVDVVS